MSGERDVARYFARGGGWWADEGREIKTVVDFRSGPNGQITWGCDANRSDVDRILLSLRGQESKQITDGLFSERRRRRRGGMLVFVCGNLK